MVCPWCGYSLSGLARARCPECGRPFGAAEARHAAALHTLRSRALPICVRAAALPIAAGFANGGVGLALGLAPIRVLGVMAVGWALALLCFLVGVPVTACSRPWERAPVFLSWMRCAWWLLLPWLALPGIALLAAGAWVLLNISRADRPDALVLMAIVVVPPWATIALAGILAWAGAWFESEKLITHRPRLRAASALLGTVLLLLVGIAGALYTGLLCFYASQLRWLVLD